MNLVEEMGDRITTGNAARQDEEEAEGDHIKVNF